VRELRPGHVLDRRYKIESLIARGGMGAVYRARRTRLGDVVAIKVIHMTRGSDAALRKRFMAEAQMCAKLHHPHIVSVLDFGVEAVIGPYLVMEHLEGPSLNRQVETSGPLDLADVCRIASQVGGALDIAHSHGVVHGDVKPGNIMAHRYAAGDLIYKVIDFGIGRMRGRRAGGSTSADGSILVTPAYASPEQLSGGPVGAPSDIYSFGVTLYVLLTGHQPFTAADADSVIDQHLRQPPEPPTRYRPEIPASIEAAVLRALAKDPESRWESASDFARALAGEASSRVPVVPVSASRLSDEYDVAAQIGRGRLGSSVYEGTHRATGHKVAIRVLRQDQTTDWEAAKARFFREARMAPLNHPSILRVRDYGDDKDLVYVITDFVPGSSLREVLDQSGAFPWTEGRHLLGDLISATRALHAQGLLAFGLTPSIIRLTHDGDRLRLVISSAGVVGVDEVLSGELSSRSAARAPIPRDAFYLAPELLIGAEPDGRTDIFMIGAIGYELFTGRLPFRTKTWEQLVTAIVESKIVDPRTHAPSLPTDAALCLLRCLTTRPDKRFADAIELESAWSVASRRPA
jgi:serine/threonine protein kinase